MDGALTCGCCGIAWRAGAPPGAPGTWHALADGRIVLVNVVRLNLVLDEGADGVVGLGLFVAAGPGSYVKVSEYRAKWLTRA
jgi:hypothetical protein